MELITQQALNNIFQQKRTLQGQKINNYDFIDNNEVSDSDEDDENDIENGVTQNNNQYQSNQTYVQQNYQSEFQQQSSNQLDGFENNQQKQQIGIQQINLELIQEQNQKIKNDVKVKFNLKQQQLENMESCEVRVQPYQFEPPLIQIINPYQSSSQMEEYQQMTEEQLFHNNNNQNNNSNSNKNSLNHNKQSHSSQQSSYQVYNNHLQKRKLWQEWPGKNMICCGGFLITGPRKYMCYNLLYWIFEILLYLVYSYQIINDHFIQYLYGIILVFIFSFLTIMFQIIVQFSDPGIIPRKGIKDLIKQGQKKYFNKEILNLGYEDLQLYVNQYQNGQAIQQELKICSTCKYIQQGRTEHCEYCDNCVQVNDHHNKLLNNCIGKRNYKYLILWQIFNLINTAIMFALCVLIISSDWPDNRDIWKIVLSLVLLVYFILILGFLGICILLRCRTNQTFIEWWKQQRQVNMNYDENIQEYTDNFDKCISKKGLFDLRQIIYV